MFKTSEVGLSLRMTGVVWSSAEEDHLVYFPGESPLGDPKVKTTTLEEWSDIIHQSDLVLVASTNPMDPEERRMLRKSERQISQQVSWTVYRRDKYACRYCGNDATPLTVDHLVTWESGGPSTEDNLVSSCKKCNGARGNLSYGEWLNSPYYQKVSGNLTPEVRAENVRVLSRLDKIRVSPRGAKRSR